jgi:23S rRNA (guanosine2251-2'-O)-methyltransferase
MQNKQLFVLVHNIRSLHNVGSIFRTADVFAVSKLFLSGYTGHPPDDKISKVSLGAENTVPWEYNKSAIRLIKKLKKDFPRLKIIGLENNLPKGEKAISLPSFHQKSPVLLILGEEVSGISKSLIKLCDSFVEIPQYGQKESLNVSVAFGIAAYDIGNKRQG